MQSILPLVRRNWFQITAVALLCWLVIEVRYAAETADHAHDQAYLAREAADEAAKHAQAAEEAALAAQRTASLLRFQMR